MHPSRPAGFVFLAVCALASACVMAAALGLGHGPPPVRFALGATGALALVVAEALAFVRPWAFGASLAFAGTFIAMLLVVSGDMTVFIILGSLSAFFILLALSIVYNGTHSVTIPPVARRRYFRAP